VRLSRHREVSEWEKTHSRLLSSKQLNTGEMVVTMRLFPGDAVADAVRIMSRFPRAHGTPVHIGDPGEIGIEDLGQVMFGEPPVIRDGDVPVFTPCGVTSQAVAQAARPDLMIAHYPAHMLVADLTCEQMGIDKVSLD